MGKAFRILGLISVAAVQAFAFAEGPPPERTGAPPGLTCTVCHGGTANSGSGNVKIEFLGGSTYTPGASYKVRVTVTDGTAQRWGFEITARKGADKLTLAGVFAVDNATTTQFSPGSTPGEYVVHTPAGTAAGTRGANSWEVNWTAPAAGTGTVTFYAAGNAANGNGTNQGDLIYTTSLAINEAGPAVSGKTFALPQLAFGGGWYTALYFTNTTDAAAVMEAKFYGLDGKALSVPVVGAGPATSQTVTLAPKATTIIEAPNTGSLQQGWVEATLPTGVTGYAIFRQSSGGRADQEAVVPLSDASKSVATLIWDEVGLTTALALVNTGDNAATVTIAVFGPDGAPIGTATMNVPPDNRMAFNLREQTGLAGMVGKRGSARISVPAGSVAALGLRFGDSAFTSIPVDYP